MVKLISQKLIIRPKVKRPIRTYKRTTTQNTKAWHLALCLRLTGRLSEMSSPPPHNLSMAVYITRKSLRIKVNNGKLTAILIIIMYYEIYIYFMTQCLINQWILNTSNTVTLIFWNLPKSRFVYLIIHTNWIPKQIVLFIQSL